jgi:hypothetical protein
MRTLTARRLGAVAATPLLLGSLVACGNDKTDNASGAPTGASSSTGTPSSSETTGSTGTEIDVADFARQLTSTFDHLTSAHVSMQMKASGSVITAEGDVNYSGDSPAMALTMEGFGNGKVEMRLVDKAMYMSLPPSVQQGAQAGKFYKIDLSDPNNPLGASLGSLSSFDPKKTFDMFSTGLKKVVKIGVEQVGGDDTTHYVLTIDTKQIAKQLPAAAQAQLPATMAYDVWLDSENRMRKMEAEMPGAGHLTMELSKWGVPVEIKAPSKDQVIVLPSQ